METAATKTEETVREGAGAATPLATSGIAAVLAGVCCAGPLVAIVLGVSGTWAGAITALEPWRPAFLAAGWIALYVAWRRIFKGAACAPGSACPGTAAGRTYRRLFYGAALLMVAGLLFPYVAALYY